MRFRIVGRGRAGGALAIALARCGWVESAALGRADDPAAAGDGVDLVVIATPDTAIAAVASAIRPVEGVVVAHLAGSRGLEVLHPHPRRAAIHPLVALPDAETGAARLGEGSWFAVAGDPLCADVVHALGGRSFPVEDGDRDHYHAAACIAANHLVALLGQVERVAPDGVPLPAYLDLARGALRNVAELGPAAALTGPAARGDEATIARHLAALAPDERPAYEAMVTAARRLAATNPAARPPKATSATTDVRP